MDAVTPLVGRRREQQRLETLLAEACAGVPAMALLHGEPGIGKTLLAAAVAADAEGRQVLAGQCLRLTASSAPYLPLVTALNSWLRAHPEAGRPIVAAAAPALVPLLPSLAGDTKAHAGPVAADGRVLPAWEQALRALTRQAPTVLVVDDVQWADGSSLDVLSYLAASLAGQRLLVLVTYRDTELADGAPLHTWLADVHRLPHVHDFRLARLTEAATRDQVRLLTGVDPDPALVAALHRRSRGNPYLTELLVAHTEADPDRVATALPEELRGAVLADWHRLPAPARELTRLLAVAGRPVDPDLLARVVASRGEAVEDLGAHLRGAAAAGVLASDERGRTWFRHPLIAEALYGELLPGERRALHAAFADGGPPDRADVTALGEHARHCERAGRADEAFEHLLHAAEAARDIQAYRERAEFYRGAANLWPQLSPSVQERHGPVVRLLLTAADAVRWAGDEPAALKLVERARAAVDPRADPVTAGYLLAWWAELAYTTGILGPFPLAEFEDAVALTAARPDSAEHSRALADLAQALVWHGAHARAGQVADAAVAAAGRGRDAIAGSYALYCRTLTRLGDAAAVRDAEDSYRLALASGDLEQLALACIARANAAEGLGDPPGAAAAALEGHRAAARVGLGGSTRYLAIAAAYHLLLQGDLARVDELVREVLAGRPVGSPGVQARALAVVLAVRRDDLDLAARHWSALEHDCPAWREHSGLRVPSAAAELLLATGRPVEALAVLETTLTVNGAADPAYGDTMMLWAARSAADVAERDRHGAERAAAQKALGRIADARQRLGTPFAGADHSRFDAAQRALFQAERARLAGEPGAMVECWRRAVAAAAEAGCSYLRTEARYRLAESLFHAGHRVDAAVELRAGHREATAMGAVALTRAMETLARLARVDVSDPQPPRVTAASADALAVLTAREREVLGHLLAGRSYAEIARELFISEKTVSVHVSNLLHKTGTANRTAAAIWARDHGVVPGDG